MQVANPYLNFSGNTEAAFQFYRSVFGGEFTGVVRYRDLPDNEMGVPEAALDKIAHIALPLGSHNVLMGTDVVGSRSGALTVGNNFYITLEADSRDEAERVFSALAEGGGTDMPLQKTGWAEHFGICTDRFGVQWMVSYTGDVEYAARPQS